MKRSIKELKYFLQEAIKIILMWNRPINVILVILGFRMMVVIKDLENTGYKMSWLVILIWRCYIFHQSLNSPPPERCSSHCCVFSWVLCKCVVTLFPVRNHWLMFKFPWLTAGVWIGFVACCSGKMWTVRCDVWADVEDWQKRSQNYSDRQQVIHSQLDKWIVNTHFSLMKSDFFFRFFETSTSMGNVDVSHLEGFFFV